MTREEEVIMPKVNVYDMQGNVVGEIELDSNIFGVEINTHCMQTSARERILLC